MLHAKAHKFNLHFALSHYVYDTIEILNLQNVNSIWSLFRSSFNWDIFICIRLLLLQFFNICCCFFKVSQEIIDAKIVYTKFTIVNISNYFHQLLNDYLRLIVRKISIH